MGGGSVHLHWQAKLAMILTRKPLSKFILHLYQLRLKPRHNYQNLNKKGLIKTVPGTHVTWILLLCWAWHSFPSLHLGAGWFWSSRNYHDNPGNKKAEDRYAGVLGARGRGAKWMNCVKEYEFPLNIHSSLLNKRISIFIPAYFHPQ